ncbi:sulfatase-like hydrolase/transferase [Sphingobacterium phlebotomi]|uniref:Sulfatase-like hydrolase/transferase n=1 Tax=Sphingobacterium phlebotomi TaxID=2605433 RepID=A0A5D4H446_9SPHI|nr:sulfatase-like hydrolase/transferase [Sphingobacterium phlebotomi]TYR35811.1 sulfatase-like hydrolase/transferase [Sphingobacterium phlebotomi]
MKKIIAMLLLATGNIGLLWGQEKQVAKPNIIFILMDDMGYGDLGVFFQKIRQQRAARNEPWLVTPNLDRMAAEGAILPQHYAAAPVCAPSRASILTGLSQGRANVRDNQFDKALEDNYTLGNVLQQAGYHTAAIGKWGLQGVGEAPNWPAHPLKRGFDYYFGYMAHVDGHEHYPKEGVYKGPKKVWENYREISDDLDKCYTGDLFTAVAKRYITTHQQEQPDQPFFMYLAYDTPHAVLELPTQAYPEGKGLKGGVQWMGTPGNMINTASGKVDSYLYPQYAQETYDHDSDATTPEVPWPDVYKRYASINYRIDEQIADILQLLTDLEIDEQTLVVFTSDNGTSIESYLDERYEADFFQGFGPFDGIKRDLYEGGLRVPTIVRWPGSVAPNTVINSASISYDWLPTFTDIAGLPAPVRSDGVSLLPSLTQQGEQKESLVYAEYFHPGVMPTYSLFAPQHRGKRRNQMQMIQVDDLIGVRYDVQSATDDFEIYDVINDPRQTKNLALQKADIQQRMKDRVLQLRVSDTSAARPYDDVFIPGLQGIESRVSETLDVKFYALNTTWLPQVGGIEPTAVTSVNRLDLVPQDTGLVVVRGYIYAPTDGAYTFYLSGASQTFARIHERTLIDADYHTSGEEMKSTLKLASGYHPIEIYYRNVRGNSQKLQFEWRYEDGPRESWK